MEGWIENKVRSNFDYGHLTPLSHRNTLALSLLFSAIKFFCLVENISSIIPQISWNGIIAATSAIMRSDAIFIEPKINNYIKLLCSWIKIKSNWKKAFPQLLSGLKATRVKMLNIM